MKSKVLLLGLLMSISSVCVFAQTETENVKVVIESLFEGMRTKNVDQIASVFTEHAIMQTITTTNGIGEVKAGSVEDFLKGIKGLSADTNLDERITDYQIKVDGPLATAWTPYQFYMNDEFSHCGVNSFQLVKTGNGWKIIYIIDTRRKKDCA